MLITLSYIISILQFFEFFFSHFNFIDKKEIWNLKFLTDDP